MTNHIIENERRVIDLGREEGERRRQLNATAVAVVEAKRRFEMSMLGLAGSLLFAILYCN